MTDLSTIVLRRCEQDCLPPDHTLRKLATDFDLAVGEVVKEATPDSSRKMLGAWARLRKEWSAYSGEPLI